MIDALKEKEFFVFGSNTAGRHVGGAARQAREQFGAEEGIGEGLTGRCYAFPTLDEYMEKLPRWVLALSRDKFYATARALPEYTFLLTAVGTGIAGYEAAYMKSLFTDPPANVVLPDEFK